MKYLILLALTLNLYADDCLGYINSAKLSLERASNSYTVQGQNRTYVKSIAQSNLAIICQNEKIIENLKRLREEK